MDIQNFRSVLIKKEYFEKNSHFIKMLDKDNVDKQANRNYLFIEVKLEDNRLLIPLRTRLGEANRAFGTIGFSVPSESKPLAGLDYRYILIVNDEEYLSFQERLEIPKSQLRILNDNYEIIADEARDYVKGYIACAVKNRAEREPKYRESSLQNFNSELKVAEARLLREKEKQLKKLQRKSNKTSPKEIDEEGKNVLSSDVDKSDKV